MADQPLIPEGHTPVISPDGQPGSVPTEKLNETLAIPGFKKAVMVTSPEGHPGLVPQDKAAEALKNKFTIGQPTTSVEKGSSGPVSSFLREAGLGFAGGFGAPESEHPIADAASKLFEPNPSIENKDLQTGAPNPSLGDKIIRPAVNLAKNIATMHYQEGKKAIQDFKDGNYAHGLIRAAGTVAPVVGPGIAEGGIEAGDAIQQTPEGQPIDYTKVGHGLGTAAGSTVAGLLGTEKGGEVADSAITKTGGAVVNAAEKTADLAQAGAQRVGQVADVIHQGISPDNIPAETAATKAFKPRNSKANWKEEINTSLPYIRRAVDSAGVDVNSATLQDALDATTQAKKDVWKEYQQSYRDPNVDEAVNTTPVADAIRKTVTQRQTEQNPGLVDQVNKIADTYDDRNLSVGDIEDRVRELNNETSAIEARYNMQKRIAKADPVNAPIFAERDTLRQLMLDKMDELSGEGAADLRKKYGALNSVEDAISRRIPVAERQNPMGLAKILSRGMAYGKMAGGILTLNPGLLAEGYVQNLIHKNAEKLNNPDWLTQQALRKTQAAAPAPPPVERVDGEYITEPEPKQLEGGQQALPPGQYDQPGGAMEPILAPRQPQLPWGPRAARPAYQLPEKAGAIPLPAEFPVPSNTRETVGIPEAQEPAALQRAVDQKGQPQPLPFLKRQAAEPQVAPGREPAAIPTQTPTPAAIAAPEPPVARKAENPASPGLPSALRAKKPVLNTGERVAGVEGKPTTVLTPNGEMDGRYRLVEADDLRPSHNAMTFAKNPNYPEGVQERAYHTSKEAQARVIQQGQNYDPRYTVNSNPDAVNGPPVVTPDGTVLGGNSRTMSTQRLYGTGKGDAYKSFLRDRAGEYGMTPEQVDGMKKPVLVREIAAPASADEARRVGSDLNKSMTGALGVSERAVSAGKSIKPESLAKIGDMLDNAGEGSTLRDIMRSRPQEIVQMLQRDGVITDRERPQFIDTSTGGLSEEGKNFVERALMGSVVDDPVLMDRAPKSILGKLEGSLGDLAHVGSRQDDYNIMPIVRQALEDHAQIAERGSNVSTYLAQPNLMGPERNPLVDAVTRTLAEKPTAVRAKIKQFTQDAKFDVPGQSAMGFGKAPSPVDAFNNAFGTDLNDQQYTNQMARVLSDYAEGKDRHGGTIANGAESLGSETNESRNPKGPDESLRPVSASPSTAELASGVQQSGDQASIRSGESTAARDTGRGSSELPEKRQADNADRPVKGDTHLLRSDEDKRDASDAPLSPREIMDKYKKQGVDSWISENKNGVIELSKIEVPKGSRKQGIGTAFMQDLANYADATGKTISLTPSTDFGATSVNRLKDFYRRFGFKKNQDSRISDSMVREPKSSSLESEDDGLITGRSPDAETSIAKNMKFSVETPGDGLPAYVKADRNAMQVLTSAAGKRFRGANLSPAHASKMLENLGDIEVSYRETDPEAADRVADLRATLQKANHEQDGLNIVGQGNSKSEEIATTREELFHSATQRRLGGEDLDAAIPFDALKGDRGFKLQSSAVRARLGSRATPTVIAAEALHDIVSGEHALDPADAKATATKYWAALDTKTLETQAKLNGYIDSLYDKHGIVRETGGPEDEARSALDEVLSRRRGTETRKAGSGVQKETVQGNPQGNPGASPQGSNLPPDRGAGYYRPSAADRATDSRTSSLSREESVGLTDEELAHWATARDFKIEPAGEQKGMFGQDSPIVRVSHTNSKGKIERGLAYQSQLDKLNETKNGRFSESPLELQAQDAGEKESPDQLPLYGAGDLGEILGPTKPSGVPSFLKSKPPSSQGSLFRGSSNKLPFMRRK